MIDEQHLTKLKLHNRSPGQILVARLFLMPNYGLPPRVNITIENGENIPSDRRVMFAMNHTDRYNYWPFQYKMWRENYPFTTTWVKGKYYENKLLGWFFDKCNNIPLPSRGYLIFQDARDVLNRKLADEEYRLLRDLVDGTLDQADPHVRAGIAAQAELQRIFTTPRRDYQPDNEPYAQYLHRWNDRLMGLVEKRTLEALHDKQNNVIVFPQGTRSIALLPGLPGLAQFALRHNIDIVPVGSMGSENAYPTASPWAKGADLVYRVGKPLTVEGALAPFRVEEPYAPFTQAAEKHRDKFEGAMEVVTNAIDDLLEGPYKLNRDVEDERAKADRFV